MAIYTIPASSIVNKLNIMSYNSACTITTITVAVVRSIYSQSVRGKPGTMNQVSTAYTINILFLALLFYKSIDYST